MNIDLLFALIALWVTVSIATAFALGRIIKNRDHNG